MKGISHMQGNCTNTLLMCAQRFSVMEEKKRRPLRLQDHRCSGILNTLVQTRSSRILSYTPSSYTTCYLVPNKYWFGKHKYMQRQAGNQ